ncbi:bifunctional phosphopantothenoylcysteine decarboxylase/phosphopantothenate--cysteine ligase CoaBC [Fundicoccus culcitae]|uniref:Coenzyme A biosynthesis bifunctional protein CoaBC n=1 Tax=Fundicoccus culcitae TaxID=2969821 RepID=A0ABY5P4T2_9LACT|nr:bifunctional phosphopantothenoylcysteine decarboxylase/phosphopantothenate--cysteine ligase CoaBC [Fundicoccus culcitae]UUX33702.1 bifunctional phosphopantothenoylcysteine decarboxylase/phosphopantothenate--cysteine ligase CoaBC [Fundicoccus culcitae]
MLRDKHIGIFITGGIASYKIPELARQLIKKGAMVRVVMSKAATEFITPLTMQILTKQAVLVDVFDEKNPASVQHVEMADWVDMAVVVPATANIIAKMANGIADEIVSTTLLAVNKPRLIVPAMNTKMYDNPATQNNLETLAGYGDYIMEPETGFLAEGYEGKGRLPELGSIVQMIEFLMAKHSYPQLLANKKVVISAGATKERIDPVRYITNDSSGKMGYAMATAATWLGADVTLVSSTQRLTAPINTHVIPFENALELQTAMETEAKQADYVMMVAAVSDYRVAHPQEQKIKKQHHQSNQLTLELIENPDILKGLAAQKNQQIMIGFAAETENLIEHAQAKLQRKKVDWIIANQVGKNHQTGFNTDDNQVTLLSANGERFPLPLMSKLETALAAWQIIAQTPLNK